MLVCVLPNHETSPKTLGERHDTLCLCCGGTYSFLLVIIDDAAVHGIESALRGLSGRGRNCTSITALCLGKMHRAATRTATADSALKVRSALRRHLDELRVVLIRGPLIDVLFDILEGMVGRWAIRECWPIAGI